MNDAVLEVSDLRYAYSVGGREVPVLKGVGFSIRRGDFVAIQGPSGSGKSTLFYLLGGLLKPDSGSIRIDGTEMTTLSRDELAVLRNRSIGFVFQQFHLLPGSSVLQNLLLPARYPLETAHVTAADEARAKQLVGELGIGGLLGNLPNQLSGGQQQRVAIARALMRDVDMILADEPTGALDSTSAAATMDLLESLHKRGKTVLIITHDNEVAARCRRVLRMRDGELVDSADANASVSAAPSAAMGSSHERFSLGASFSSPAARLRLALASITPAFANLRRNKIQSALTMLGVVIGVAAVLAMTTLGNFTKRKILESYESMGVNRLGVAGYRNWRLKAADRSGVVFSSFNLERDIEPLPRLFPEIEMLSPVMSVWRSVTVTYGGTSYDSDTRVMGVDATYFPIANVELSSGVPINAFHVANRSLVCVLGPDIVERLYNGRDAIGTFVMLTSGEDFQFPCRVIGVKERKQSPKEWDKPNAEVLVPYPMLQTIQMQINQVTIRARAGTNIEDLQKSIKGFYEQRYGTTGQFMVDSDAALVDQMRRFLTLFSVLLSAIAALALVVGGIGINNMMLVSINERVREFGLRKALGATDASLRVQILMESFILCLTAGLIGIALGFTVYEGLIYGASKLVPKVQFEWVVEAPAVLIASGAMICVGLLSGLVPALKAQRLEVMEALRSE